MDTGRIVLVLVVVLVLVLGGYLVPLARASTFRARARGRLEQLQAEAYTLIVRFGHFFRAQSRKKLRFLLIIS